jgi:hypothetical protein
VAFSSDHRGPQRFHGTSFAKDTMSIDGVGWRNDAKEQRETSLAAGIRTGSAGGLPVGDSSRICAEHADGNLGANAARVK